MPLETTPPREVLALLEQVQSHLHTELSTWADTAFPGITLEPGEVNTGSSGIRPALIGHWDGLHLHLERRHDGAFSASLVTYHPCCQAYTHVLGDSSLRDQYSLLRTSAAVLAEATNPRRGCFSCTWLTEAKADAAKVGPSRFARWRFKCRRGLDVDVVRSRTR